MPHLLLGFSLAAGVAVSEAAVLARRIGPRAAALTAAISSPATASRQPRITKSGIRARARASWSRTKAPRRRFARSCPRGQNICSRRRNSGRAFTPSRRRSSIRTRRRSPAARRATALACASTSIARSSSSSTSSSGYPSSPRRSRSQPPAGSRTGLRSSNAIARSTNGARDGPRHAGAVPMRACREAAGRPDRLVGGDIAYAVGARAEPDDGRSGDVATLRRSATDAGRPAAGSSRAAGPGDLGHRMARHRQDVQRHAGRAVPRAGHDRATRATAIFSISAPGSGPRSCRSAAPRRRASPRSWSRSRGFPTTARSWPPRHPSGSPCILRRRRQTS